MENKNKTYPSEAFMQEIERLSSMKRTQLCQLLDGCTLIQKSRNVFNSDEYKGRISGVEVFIKTFIHRSFFVRMIYGRRVLRNEFATNEIVISKGSGNVARPYCWIGRDTVVFEYIRNRGKLENPRHHQDFVVPSRLFFAELVNSIRALHESGVAHGDIRRANIMIGEDGHPWLVDTAAAVVKKGTLNIFKALMFHVLKAADDYAVAKIVLSYYPDWEDAALRKGMEKPPWFLVLGHNLRRIIYPFFRKKRRAIF